MQSFVNFIKGLDNDTIAIIIGSLIVGIVLLYLRRFHKVRDTKKSNEAEKVAIAEKEFSEVRKEFISVFDDALRRLHSKGQHANGILSETMPDHKSAHEKFRRVLQKIRGVEAIGGLDKAWKEYYDTKTYGKNPFAAYDSGGEFTKERKQKDKDLAITKINALIDFVNQL